MGTHVGAVHLSYSLGLLGLKMIYFIPENHNKKTLEHRTLLVYHNLYCFVATYAVLMHSMVFCCNMCCFIAIYAIMLPFCRDLRHFVAIYAVLSQFTLFCRDNMIVAKYALSQALLRVVPRHFELL